jgi:hypothetical protein
LRNELQLGLSTSELLIIDTAFSTGFLYIYAFVVMHSLTKSFNLKMSSDDPLYDLFIHSEYIHLWLSHIVTFVGVMAIMTFFSALNLFFPLQLVLSKALFYAICGVGLVSGLILFVGIWNSDPKQENAHFMRLMKLAFGFFFIIHVVLLFLFDPSFSANYLAFWYTAALFTMTVVVSLFAYKSPRAQNLLGRLADLFKHEAWHFRAQLFKK